MVIEPVTALVTSRAKALLVAESRVPAPLPVTVTPGVATGPLMVQPLRSSLIEVASDDEPLSCRAGLNFADPVTVVQVTWSVETLIGRAFAPAMPPVAARKPSGIAVAGPIIRPARIMCRR